MKTIASTCVRKLFPSLLALLLVAAASGQALPYLFDPSSGTPNKLFWRTEPGLRYDLWKSDNLASWSHVAGYPAAAAGLAMEYAFIPGPQGFFKILPVDEQPPVVVAQYPSIGGFAVGRFADLAIELDDASGIDPASIRLSAGLVGPLAQGAPGFTISGGTITYDSGDAALGAWGETLTATLVAADTLGHSLTHTWTFRLEPQPQTAANVFVFGSPTAQRSGQQVSGPAAALASGYPVPAGPVKANDPPPWQIESVLADRIVIAYEAGGAPSFITGQLICNLTPATEEEIFYRRVVSVSDDAGALRLTLMTEDKLVSDFVIQGASSFSDSSVVFELDAAGALARALSFNGSLDFPRIGFDLSGSSFKLKDDGYEATVKGVTYSQGSNPTFLEVDMRRTPEIGPGAKL